MLYKKCLIGVCYIAFFCAYSVNNYRKWHKHSEMTEIPLTNQDILYII